MPPGDGCREESGGVAAALERSEKSALGEGWGAWGEGNTPCAPAKGVSFPPENDSVWTLYVWPISCMVICGMVLACESMATADWVST